VEQAGGPVSSGSQSQKVAILGGGPAAITAAFELTAPELENRFEVTVYLPGWRLGGKCASGRNMCLGERIEEHGLHLWFGFYENAFTAMRAAYEELKRPASHPLATLEDAFKGCNEIVLCDRQGEGWTTFAFTAPANGQKPGTGLPLPSFWQIAVEACKWAQPELHKLSSANTGAGLDPAISGERQLAEATAQAEQAQSGIPSPDAGVAFLQRFVALLCDSRDLFWKHVVRERCAADPHLRLFFTMYDTFVSSASGIVNDGVLENGWKAINGLELCEWLSSHGAKEVTVGATPAQRCPLLRSIYDVAFGYPEGKIANANVAAGTAMNDLLRLCFTYRGSIMYKMQAGMGDTVFTPFYEVLRRRGVQFEFFHAVTKLHLSPAADGNFVESIDVVPQVELTVTDYSPLVISRELECWPDEPDWGQLKDGEQLKAQHVNFELEMNPLSCEENTLQRGVDFDSVVLGIPVGALAPICVEIAERCAPFARMLDSAVTVSTQAFQLWLTRTIAELGWPHNENAVVGCYEEPVDTWCDMTHLKEREAWPPSAPVNGLAYFCGVLEDVEGESNKQATERVQASAQAFLEGQIAPLWPHAVSKGPGGGFDWTALVDLQQRTGAARFLAQYWRANTTPSERYVLTPAKTVEDRLGANESGVLNLMLAGDWTRNGVDGGCVEAAMTSGMQAARALIGVTHPITGESDTWLTAGAPKVTSPAAGASKARQ
jgi:uncharacterized protein with NAD-binding domain and iron-sulfur cluster